MRVVNPVTERAGVSGRDPRRVLTVLDELGNVQKVRVGGLVRVTVGAESARKARTGSGPAIGDRRPGDQCRRARSTAGAGDGRVAVDTKGRRLAA
jgi:hypothetical protein